MLRKILSITLASLITFVLGCVPAPNTTNKLASTGQLSQLAPRFQTTQLREYTPYLGNLAIKIDTGLTNPLLTKIGFVKNNTPKVFDLVSPSPSSFSIQAKKLPDGAIPFGATIFNETFTHNGPGVEAVRDFDADRTKRYTLVVINGNAQGKHRAQGAKININGFDWVRGENDFDGHRQEHQPQEIVRPTLLLQAKNTMRVDVTGEIGDTITVKIIEGGVSGRIIRRTEPLGAHPTHKSHIEGNDKIWFDPDDPTSLGDLKASESIPKDEYRSIGTMAVNGEIQSNATGEVVVRVAAPVQANLNTILAQYNGEVVKDFANEGDNSLFLLKLDANKASIKNLITNVRELNGYAPEPSATIKDVSLDSTDAAKMFALMVELLLKVVKDGTLLGVDANPIMESGSPVNTKEGAAPIAKPNVPQGTSLDADNSWWLNHQSTRVTEAWNYSLGFMKGLNRPVRVGVADRDFRSLRDTHNPDLKTGDNDFAGQVLTTRQAIIDKNSVILLGADSNGVKTLDTPRCPTPNDPNAECSNKIDHGTKASSTIASAIDNKKGIAGIAPHAKIVPIRMTGVGNSDIDIQLGWDIILAIHAAIGLKLDVISFTTFTSVNSNDIPWNQKFNQVKTDWITGVQQMINAGHFPGRLICVFAAGNYGVPLEDMLPSGHIENAVVVGAVESNGGSLKRALWREGILLTDALSLSLKTRHTDDHIGSSWSLNTQWSKGSVNVWAPGDDMWACCQDNALSQWAGTSAASPMVAGIIALMKAVKPDLSVSELPQFIKFRPQVSYSDAYLKNYETATTSNSSVCSNTGTVNSGQRCGIPETHTLNIKVIDALESVKAITNHEASSYIGILKEINSKPVLITSSGDLDLLPFLEESTYVPNSTFSFQNPGSGISQFSSLSQQIHQHALNAFWQRFGKNTSGNDIRFIDLKNKPVRIRGWKYFPNNEPANLEVLKVEEIGSPSLTSIQPNSIKEDIDIGSSTIAEFILNGNHLYKPAEVFFNGVKRSSNISFPNDNPNDINALRFVLFPLDLSVGTHQVSVNAPNGHSNSVQLEVIEQGFVIGGGAGGSGGGGGSGKTFTVEVFNVDDVAQVYINIANKILEVPFGQTGTIDITPYLTPGDNDVRMLVYNFSGGYTWGFTIRENGGAIFTANEGVAGVPGLGANNNDQSKTNSWVFDQTFTVNN